MATKRISLLAILIAASLCLGIKSRPKSNLLPNKPIGVLVSPKELLEIKEKANKGIEPYHTNLDEFLMFIDDLIKESEQWEPLPPKKPET